MKRLIRVLVILSCGYVAVLALLGSSGGRGFFSPDSLEYRSQFEVLLFGTELPLFRSPYRYHQHELVKFLTSKGYWKPAETNSPRWLLLFQWNRMWYDGESAFHRRLFWKRKFWIEWSNKHPDRAVQFWPRILELLRSGDDRQAAELLFEVEMAERSRVSRSI